MLHATRSNSTPFGARSTADQVLAGVDLSTKVYVVTGCDGGIGFATMQALAANGACVIGLARTLAKAASACDLAGPACKPVECDLADLTSVRAAAETVLRLELALDGVLANAGVAHAPTPQARYGVDVHFLVNYLAHSVLIDRLLERLRDGSGRIVVNTGAVAPPTVSGIDFDNLDGARSYEPGRFFSRSKFALALYAQDMARRLLARGVTINCADPGRTKNTAIDRHRLATLWSRLPFRRLAMKTPGQGAATQALLIASPRIAGITGEHWRDCGIAPGDPALRDTALAERLREVSRDIADHAGAANSKSFKVAA